MGFLGLIPADKLAATYDPENHTLILAAEGKAKKYTTGIHFSRDSHWVGGLKFDLYGWTGPIGQGDQPYVYEQKFPIILPSVISPGRDVIIATANHPKGQVVVVHWLGFGGEKLSDAPSVGDLSISDDKIPQQPPVTMNGPNEMVVMYGEPFDIKAGAESNKYGSVTIKYDSHYLLMTNAKNEDGLIIWTFDPVAIGLTQAIVTTVLPPPLIGTVQMFLNIEIIGREVAEIPKAITDGKEPGAPTEILSFLGRVFIATRLVKQTWPDAELLWVSAHLPAGVPPPTSDPNHLSQLRAAFNVGKGSVIIDSKGWGTWNKPVFHDFKILGNVAVPFPIKMDIVDAYRILVERGYNGLISSCVLRHPLGPPGEPWDEQPYYIFELSDGLEVYVGVNNGSIWPIPPVKE